MADRFLAVKDGGRTNEEGAMRLWRQVTDSPGVFSATDFKAQQQGTPSMSIDVLDGDILINVDDYSYHGWQVGTQAVVVAGNSSGFDRIDALVLYVDVSIVVDPPTVSNNPTNLILAIVEGTPDVSPVAPSDVEIQAEIGASNPFVRLYDIAVADGATSIVNADLTDQRPFASFNFPAISALILQNDSALQGYDSGAVARAIAKINTSNVLEIGDANIAGVKVMAPYLDMNSKPMRNWLGWQEAEEAWTYVSVDDPTGVIDAAGDKRSRYYPGMRISFVNNGNTIYGIITAVNGTLQSGNTRITFLHEIDPADSLALTPHTNNTNTSRKYALPKTYPLGFPFSPAAWTYYYKSSSNFDQNNPTNTTWYNAASITVPIGLWDIQVSGIAYVYDAAGQAFVALYTTLSSANNSESDTEFTKMAEFRDTTSHLAEGCIPVYVRKVVQFVSKTTNYLNVKTAGGSAIDAMGFLGGQAPTIIRCVSLYL